MHVYSIDIIYCNFDTAVLKLSLSLIYELLKFCPGIKT